MGVADWTELADRCLTSTGGGIGCVFGWFGLCIGLRVLRILRGLFFLSGLPGAGLGLLFGRFLGRICRCSRVRLCLGRGLRLLWFCFGLLPDSLVLAGI